MPQLEAARAHSRRLRNRVGAPATKSASGVRAGTDDRQDGNGAAALAPDFDGAVGHDVSDPGQAPGGRAAVGGAGGARGIAAGASPRPERGGRDCARRRTPAAAVVPGRSDGRRSGRR